MVTREAVIWRPISLCLTLGDLGTRLGNHDNYVMIYAHNSITPGSVVRKMDSAIQWKNLDPVDNVLGFPNTYPLDGDLSI